MTDGILAYGWDIGAPGSSMLFTGLDPGAVPDWLTAGPPVDVQLAGRLLDQAGIGRPTSTADYTLAVRQDLGVDIVGHGTSGPSPWLLAANGSVRRAAAGEPTPVRNLIAPEQADANLASAAGSLGLDLPATPGWLITAWVG